MMPTIILSKKEKNILKDLVRSKEDIRNMRKVMRIMITHYFNHICMGHPDLNKKKKK